MNRFALIFAGLIAAGLLGMAYVIAISIQKHRTMAANPQPLIMIRKDSLTRIIRQPCDIATITYIGNYILCRRRGDYEPMEEKHWPSPFPRYASKGDDHGNEIPGSSQ